MANEAGLAPTEEAAERRGQWTSRTGFVLAAAGSAVGLGNIWKFPYITGENGGGAFVLIYLFCILLVGVPIMVAEILLGRATRSSPVRAVRTLTPGTPWIGVGLLGIVTSFLLMSYYSIVAGWSMHFAYLSVTNSIAGASGSEVLALFEALQGSAALGMFWQVAFVVVCVGLVEFGVSGGIERCARILMPTLFVLLLVLLVHAAGLPGWGEGIGFLYEMRFDNLTAGGALEALGHAFFTLSLGMGAMITYGSYLSRKDDIVGASLATAGADTLVALVASMVVFPIVFTFGMEPGQGPGLLFVTLPTAFAQMTGGALLSVAFFVMVVFAALTSGISMLEVVTSYLIDDFGLKRRTAGLVCGLAVVACGIPSALSGTVFGQVDYLVSNWLLPLGGMGIALYVGWRVRDALRREHFAAGSGLARFYTVWLMSLKFLVPLCITLVFLRAVGLI